MKTRAGFYNMTQVEIMFADNSHSMDNCEDKARRSHRECFSLHGTTTKEKFEGIYPVLRDAWSKILNFSMNMCIRYT